MPYAYVVKQGSVGTIDLIYIIHAEGNQFIYCDVMSYNGVELLDDRSHLRQ